MELRKLKFGANVVAFSIVVTILWVMANYLNARHHHRFDLTENRQYTLSPKTIAILKDLEEPLHITTFYAPDTPGASLFRQVKDMLDEYADRSDRVTVEHIDAHRDRGKAEELGRRLNMVTLGLNTVIFESGGRSKHVPHSDVVEYDYSSYYARREPSPPKFKGEEAFTSAILECTQKKQSVLYFVTGHGERGLDDGTMRGMLGAVEYLRRQNFKVEKLLLPGKEQIPGDCDVLSIIGPEKRFSADEVDVIRNYLSSGGKALVMVDPLVDCGLGDLLGEWGVELGNNKVLIRALGPFVLSEIFTDDYGYHEITDKMKGVATVFSLARSVEFSGAGDLLEGVELVRSPKEAWGETDVRARQAKFDEEEDKKGPVSLAVAVKMGKSPYGVEEESQKTRLVVFGDADFISNAQIVNVGNAGNTDLFLNSINWLAEKEKLISIGPKSPDVRKVSLSQEQMRLIFWSTIAGLPLLVVCMWVIVWWRRRK